MSSESEERSQRELGSSRGATPAGGASYPRPSTFSPRPFEPQADAANARDAGVAVVTRDAANPGAARGRRGVDESPELLRWRADLLLDEMMLGGVDVSAADSVPPRVDARRDEPVAPAQARPHTADRAPETARPDMRPPMPSSMPASLTNAYPDLDAPAAKPWGDGQTPAPRPLPPVVSGQTPATAGDLQPRSERLHDLEQRYEQYRREQESTIQPVAAKPAPTMSAAEPPAASPAPKPAKPEPDVPVDPTTQWAESPEKWLRQDFGPTPEPPVEPPPALGDYPGAVQRTDYGDAAVRQDPAQFVNSMSVMSNKKRSNLLPRMSTLDSEQLNREMATLHAEIAELLPEGHEAGERARHLLDKAHTILNSDPMRSAEVEYYMQQVRTIVQRRRQARAWSDLYRSRLRVYLTGWFGLSLTLLVARYIFQAQLDAVAVALFGAAADGLVLRHWAPFLGAGMAGALGGAAGALYTMLQQTAAVPVLFDRKYGLRGLMLPIIGLIVGLVAYPLFGAVFGLAGVNPAANVLVGTLPALAAFAFGFAQESIYGTRS